VKQSHKTLILWLVIILVFVVFFQVFQAREPPPREMPISDVMAAVEKGDVKDIVIRGNDLYEGHFKTDDQAFKANGFPLTADLEKKLRDKQVRVTVEPSQQQSVWVQIALQFLPIALILVLFVFLMRQLQAGGGKAMSFGKSKAKLLSESHNKVTFADVAGIDEAKEELEEIIAFLKDPKKFTRLGGRIPKGVLLMGSPGTGKTLIAKAVAGEAGVPFFSISGSDFVEMFVGVGASRVRDLFEQGKRNAPCIIFIDEIDAVGRHRGAGLGGGHDEREQTLNQLLVEMDGFESTEGVIIIAATNRPDVLDPALLRPGRFDRRIVVPRPDVRGREGILKVHTKRTPLAPEVDLNAVARGTPGFSGADLENLVNEAALIAARTNKDRLDATDFEFAKDKVLMGAERRSLIMSEKERRNTAVHEAGHTIVAKLLPHCDPVHKVTIIPRGQALGVTQTLPTEDRLNMYKSAALDFIAMAMGGRIAEEIVFGEMSSGAANDIERATAYARAMVCEWGMSEKLGPLAFGQAEGEVFLGRQLGSRTKDYSEATAIEIDAEVRRIVSEQYGKAKAILEERRKVLENMAEALIEYETLDVADVDVIMNGGKIVREKPAPRVAPVPRPERKEKEREKKNILEALESLGKPPPEPSKA
jgi:cell division protease FtsH